MRMMDYKLHIKLRDRVNSSPFIFAQYSYFDGKNKWDGIYSAMDWLDVAMANIETALNDFYNAASLQKSMKFYYYIICIDIAWEAIQQLHRVFYNTNRIPFADNYICFTGNVFNQDDNTYFKTIRACFGAHSVNLNISKNEEKNFASWSYSVSAENELSIILYSNIVNRDDIYLTVDINQFKCFFEKRYGYIKELVNRIDKIDCEYCKTFRNTIIEISKDPIEQVEILMYENKKRINSESIQSTLEELKSFLEIEFSCSENKKIILNFKKKIIRGIDEIRKELQNISQNELIIDKILYPEYRPKQNMWGYEFAALYDSIFANSHKFYSVNLIVEPLNKYIIFKYQSKIELYWLIIIALDLAQDDLKADCSDTYDIDKVQMMLNGEGDKK